MEIDKFLGVVTGDYITCSGEIINESAMNINMQFSRADDSQLYHVPIVWNPRHKLTKSKCPVSGDINIAIVFHDDCIWIVSLFIEVFDSFEMRCDTANLT
jgi:hypothetical protein